MNGYITAFLPILFTITTTQMISNSCKDAEGYSGVCTLITKCPHVQARLKQKDTAYVRESSCGFQGFLPVVCCPDETKKNESLHFVSGKPGEANRPAPAPSNVDSSDSQTNSTKVIRPTSTSRPVVSNGFEMPPANYPNTLNNNNFDNREKNQINISHQNNSNSVEYVYPEPSPPTAFHPEERTIIPLYNVDRIVGGDHIIINTPINDSGSTTKPSLLPDRQSCGSITLADRIVGGDITAVAEFPWSVRLRYKKGNTVKYACGGSLISNRYVLTAAHCVRNQSTLVDVRLGEWDEESERDCYFEMCNEPPVDIGIEEIISHHGFVGLTKEDRSLKDDIALLRLVQPVTFTEFIQPVCLPTTEYIERQDVSQGSFWASGWGSTEYQTSSPIKRKVELGGVDGSICRASYKHMTNYMASRTICAGGQRGKDTCAGDSGGPLLRMITEEYQRNWFLLGVISQGISKCGTEGIPGIYTRVSAYMRWINEKMRP